MAEYKPEYCQKIIEFFSCPLTYQVIKTYTTKNGTVITEPIERPNRLPTFEYFANHFLDLSCKTLIEWTKIYPEFSDAYARAHELQKEFIVQNGTSGLLNPHFTMFVAKNITDMRDVQHVEHTVQVGLDNDLRSRLDALKSRRMQVEVKQRDQGQIEGVIDV